MSVESDQTIPLPSEKKLSSQPTNSAFWHGFISYGRADSKAFATQLHRHLTQQGLSIWFDQNDIPLGVDYQNQIDDGIEKADNFLFIIAPHSVNSPYCKKEVELALKCNKRIIPLLHVEQISYETWQQRFPQGTAADWQEYQAKGLHASFPNLHPALQKINWIYFREGVDDFDQGLQGLLEIFDRDATYVRQHTYFLAKALEWERQQKRSPYLLIGEDRLQAEAWLKVRFKDSQPPCVPTDLHCEFITESRKNAENLMTEVFLAYADENRAVAERLRNSLRREGFTVWMNTSDIHAGTDFQQVIEQGIEGADNVLYLLSAASLRSSWCEHELKYAFSLHKRVIPVRLEAIAPEEIPTDLRELQYIDLSDNQQGTDYHQDEGQLLRILRQDRAYHQSHKLLLTKALKWERQHHNPSLLLRGYNLRSAEIWLKLTQQSTAYPALPIQETFITESSRQPPNASLDVFISYSRADSGFARRLNEALQIQGKRTWFDQESIAAGTADFKQEIYRGIASADTFLFILSPRSIASPYCADEVEYAAKLNKRFVTLLHQPIDVSKLHPELAKVQWFDFNQNDGDFSTNFTELLRILDTDLEHLQAHTRLLLRAIEWNDKNRRESLLLRGDELEQAEQWFTQSASKEPKPTELQQSYITNSRLVENANQQATQILKTAAARAKKMVWVSLGIGCLMAGTASYGFWRAYLNNRVADLRLQAVSSGEKFLSGNVFQALLEALAAGQTLKAQFRANNSEWNELQYTVMGTLQQAVDQVNEKNTLDGHHSTVRSVSFSPDGQTLVSGSDDRVMKFWNVKTGQSFRTIAAHQAIVWSVSFSPDGQMVASGGGDHTIRLWDAATGKKLHTLKGHADAAWILSFSPDGQVIASGSPDRTVKLWDVTTGQELRTLKGHQGKVNSVSFSPDGQIIASGSGDNTVKLWDVATGQELRTLKGHQAAVVSISFSPDGKTIASGSNDKTIKLWDVATGKTRYTTEENEDFIAGLSFSPDGRLLASGGSDNTIRLWNTATGKLSRSLEGHQGLVWGLAFSPDGQTIASGSGDNTVKLWDLTKDSFLNTLDDHTDKVNSLSFSPKGTTLASGSGNTIKLWDATKEQSLRTLAGHQNTVRSVKFSPDGNAIASGSNDNTVKVWDGLTGRVLHTLKGHQAPITSLSFSPDGQILASGGGEKLIKLWDITTGKLIRDLAHSKDPIASLSFSPDGQTLATGGGDNHVKVWDITTGQLLHIFQGHQSVVWSVAFSPNGKMIASGSDDNTLWLWDVTTGQRHLLRGHQDQIKDVVFSPDGQTIASGSNDKTVRLWDVSTGKLLHTFKGHRSLVNSVSFSPDSQMIASGSDDKTIKLWRLDFDRLMSMGCDWLDDDYLVTYPQHRPLCKGYLPQQTR